MNAFHPLDFHPLLGLESPHLQMIAATFGPCGSEPPSTRLLIPLLEGDKLCCEVSTPPKWKASDLTIAMIHGLGGNHQSGYLIRLARKFFQRGIRTVRINLRGCGSGASLSRLPYHSGNNRDIECVLEKLKEEFPDSPINLIGFSLGGNIAIKLAGELGKKGKKLLNRVIAICPVLDLEQTVITISQPANWIYHRYYLKNMVEKGQQWVKGRSISSIYEFDDKITAPMWGYTHAEDYYAKCSCWKFIDQIEIPCDLVFAADDPFIDYRTINRIKLSETTVAWLSSKGGHMGFIGWTGTDHSLYWMDKLLLEWTI